MDCAAFCLGCGKEQPQKKLTSLDNFVPVQSPPRSLPTAGPHSLSIYPALIRCVAPRGIIGSFHHGRNGSERRREKSCGQWQRASSIGVHFPFAILKQELAADPRGPGRKWVITDKRCTHTGLKDILGSKVPGTHASKLPFPPRSIYPVPCGQMEAKRNILQHEMPGNFDPRYPCAL